MTTTKASVCPLDCPDRCSLAVEVVDGRVGRLHGTHANPMTAGTICGKVAKFARRVHGPERVLTPLRRVGPRGPGATFGPVGWDDAMSEIALRLRTIIARHGAEAILPYWYGGSNGFVTGGGLDARLWARLGTTLIERTLCASNTGAGARAVYPGLPGSDPLDIEQSGCVLLWGMNPNASGIHLVPHLRALLDRGGSLAVVDPRRIPLATKATLHVAPLPGTDVPLALALIRLAFERGWADQAFLQRWAPDADALRQHVDPWTPEAAAAVCGVRPAEIEALAELYGTATGPAMIRAGWGLERTRNGTDAVRAVLSLPAVYGKFGVRGGGYVLSTSAGYRTDTAAITPEHRGRVVNMSHLGRLLLETSDPPIEAIWIYDCNPVATVPDQQRVVRGLSREDLFVVVHEQSMTDTCDYADLVLPATTFLEHKELSRSYSGYLMGWAEPVVPPVGEARPNHLVMADLATRLGHPDLVCPEEAIARDVVVATAAAPPGTWERLLEERVVKLPSPVQFVDAFPTGSVALCGEDPPRHRPPPSDADRPYVVVSPSSTRGISSTLFETLGEGAARVAIGEQDAAALGVDEGELVRLENSVGHATLRATIDPTLRPGVLCIPKGVWRKSTVDGWTVNALIPDHVDERGGGACYNDARVDVVRLGGA
ncbi:MAG: molybdopterin-dependent oxidoreductase [Alphaproteobacteria bacterium]|nr:molybdopterin-dependent oxidoreductase [Alphaproteobacteria bacterium]